MGYMVRGRPGPSRPEGAIEPDPRLPRACIVGAGSSGIAAAKALYEARVPFDCFELGPMLGGMWVFRNPNGLSGCYSTLEMNTSGPRMAFSDFPMPSGTEDYPPHAEVGEYFERYVDHFGIRETITFNTRVEHVGRRDDGVWEVEISGEGARGERGTRLYDAVLVANGHHWDPRWPEPPFPGHFDGLQMHAHDFRDPEQLAGKRVVVLGVGNSGMDVACAASRVGEATFLAARRGVHIIRKHLKGKPVDQILAPPWLPWPLKQKGFEVMRKRSGDPTRYGLPEPDHRIGHAHPTVSDDIWEALESGAITPKPNIRELRGDRVECEDGSVERADVIVYCTGYRVSFPFFDQGFISAPGNELPLFRRTFHPEIEGVYFIGLAQPLGALMPLAEMQGRWIAELLGGRYHLPAPERIRADVDAERHAHAKRFYRSVRHTMEVDFDEWMAGVRRELRRGERRARQAGNVLPIPPRAAASAPAPESAAA